MANRVQDRSRNKGNISGGESSEEKEKKPVRGSSVKWAEEASDSWVESDVESKAGAVHSSRLEIHTPLV